jgi:hypothetical protein
VGFNQWWVPFVEFTAGGAVLVGFLAPLAALGLLFLILVAIATTGRQRIKVYKPIDEADRIDDWLYLPETLYAFMLIASIRIPEIIRRSLQYSSRSTSCVRIRASTHKFAVVSARLRHQSHRSPRHAHAEVSLCSRRH